MFCVVIKPLRKTLLGSKGQATNYFVCNLKVRNAALQTLVSAELEDHPVIIKFILQSVKKDDAVEVHYNKTKQRLK